MAAAAAAAGRRLKGARARALAPNFAALRNWLVVTRRRQSELVEPRRQMGKKSFQGGGKRVTPPVLRDNFSLEATL